ncbi:unnamed protein product [Chrysoparadoxa australica]
MASVLKPCSAWGNAMTKQAHQWEEVRAAAAKEHGGFQGTLLLTLLELLLKLSILHTMLPEGLSSHAAQGEVQLLQRLRAVGFPLKDSCKATFSLLMEHMGESESKGLLEAFSVARPYASSLECMLTGWGDDRITIDFASGKQANKYHCGVSPKKQIARGSCTCNTLGASAYQAADSKLKGLLLHAVVSQADGHADAMESIRTRLAALLLRPEHLKTAPMGMFLCPSGSDAELIPLLVARARAKSLLATSGPAQPSESSFPLVTSIMTAAGEVGSGSAGASSGAHFSPCTPSGASAVASETLQGFKPNEVSLLAFPPRDQQGAFDSQEQELVDAAASALAGSTHRTALLHVVMGSKTGLCCPSLPAVREMKARHGSRLVVVIDACQLRVDLPSLHDLATELDALVLLTGSKFFCGPPFSGCVMVPQGMMQELEAEAAAGGIPPGVGDYFSRHDMPRDCTKLRAALPAWRNHGLCLRWMAALPLMEAFQAIEKTQRDAAIASWVKGVKGIAASASPYLTMLPEEGDGLPGAHGNVNTLVSMTVRVPAAAAGPEGSPEEALSCADLKLFHKWLAMDLSGVLPSASATEAKAIVCAGQPVKLGGSTKAVIRLALGADMVVNWFNQATGGCEAGIKESLEEDELFIAKCVVMAKHWHQLKDAMVVSSKD